MSLQKWKVLTKEDVSLSKWLPIEKRRYLRPDGEVVDDFYVVTLEDSAHTIALTKEGKVMMIKMYKQGADEIMIQFPAGRIESKHQSPKHAAATELIEEAGIKVVESELDFIAKISLASTKNTEMIHYFVAKDVVFNSKQDLDDNEEIEVITLSPAKVDEYILTGKIWDAPCIAGWTLAKAKYPELFGKV